jgi:LmbE family N-acetylglucosaminyl deacetylase
MGRVLAMVFAHPDDDAYAAGSVALHADDPRFRFVLVLATSGEAGEIADGSNATRQTLAAVRQIDFVVDTSSVAHRVRAAMREHRSQWNDLNPAYLTEEQLRKNVSREPYVIAWPQPPPNRNLTDLFQDL